MEYVVVQRGLSCERECSMVVTRASVAPEVLGSTLYGNEYANILGFNSVVHSVAGDVPVDSEAPVVTLSISRICWLCLRRYS